MSKNNYDDSKIIILTRFLVATIIFASDVFLIYKIPDLIKSTGLYGITELVLDVLLVVIFVLVGIIASISMLFEIKDFFRGE